MMLRKYWVLFLGVLILTATSVSCEDEDLEVDDVEDEDAEDGSQEPETDGDVVVLTQANFESEVMDKDTYLVEFYAPWCGHCKALTPAYSAAATRLKEKGIILGKVDATVETELGQQYEVSGYPTLKFFKKGKAYEYDGPRDADGIVKFMEERASSDWKPPPEAVLTLTKDDFDETVNNADLILVEFYAPWCGHCKRLAPEYEKAAQDLQKNDPPIPLAKVDATVENELAKRYDVTGYPTLKIFRKGKPFEYKGERTRYGISDYMRKQTGDGSKEKKTSKEVRDSTEDYDITVVGFFEDDNVPLFKTYMDAANELREEYTFFHTFASDVDVKPNSIVVFMPDLFYTKYEPKWFIFDEPEASQEAIVDFIKSHQVPLVGQYSQKTDKKRYADKRPLVVAFYTVDFSHAHKQATQLWRNKFADIAKDFKDLTFVIADEDEQSQLFTDLGFLESGEEFNVGILDNKERKFPMEPMEEYDEDTIRDFIDKFKKGKLKPKLKSQPAPKKQGPVVTVVGKTFEEIVEKEGKDVLIEFYAPWCGHCKKLEPTYKKLAKKLKNNKDLVIAKIDATANDYPAQYKVEGFPAIYLSPAKNKNSPVKYEGARELKDLMKFIKDNASGKISTDKDEL